MYEDVLIATDGSEVASDAASVGVSFAQTLEVTVHVLAVVESSSAGSAQRDKRESDAETVEAKAANAGCDVRLDVRTGRPADEILSYTDEHDIDAIVVGTHGRTGLRQALLGSVALAVIRDASVPVLTVGADAVWTDSIDDVLLATDGMSGAAAATEQALSIAAACDATVHTLYAIDVDPDVPELQEGFEEHGRSVTTGVADRATERGLDATTTLVHGPPHEVIGEYAAEEDVDLLVMGTESKSNLERLVVGSVSQRVVPDAPVPVLTARTIER
ncbi:universal stress protein [Salinadaptatus halalkaliphilus]|uniref:Universal stress protein n=1 Tax=Salinadaptatus halalkaliphilus TaxID=2419781 RepID=A0A4S3TJS2_9EURY|nr:universal stress protein [Salinadaptatus halalkaliphilus]THE64312.1 universal stress protein [Salinadaptatus halalkaliphilus]